MDNPLEQPAPDDPIARVREFARDLAWGVTNKLWDNEFNSFGGNRNNLMPPSYGMEFINFLNKWRAHAPEIDQLTDSGYLTFGRSTHHLTEKAFALLEKKKPKRQLRVFISHKQKESSEFASLIEARLYLADPDIEVFIDKSIKGGEKWPSRIEEAVRNCDFFICIFGPETPKSTAVRKELDLALASNRNILWLTHHGYKEIPNGLNYIQRCAEVGKENADGYEIAILKLLNDMGYPTLQSPRPSAPAG